MLGYVFWFIPEPAGGLLSRLAGLGVGTAQIIHLRMCLFVPGLTDETTNWKYEANLTGANVITANSSNIWNNVCRKAHQPLSRQANIYPFICKTRAFCVAHRLCRDEGCTCQLQAYSNCRSDSLTLGFRHVALK